VAAATLTGAAQLAGAAAERDVLGRGLGEVRASADGHAPRRVIGLGLLLERSLEAVEIERWQELPVGQLLESLDGTGNTGEALDAVVPRRNVGVADRPVDAVAVLEVGVEVVVAESIGLPAPGDRSATQVIAADPGERPIARRRIGMFTVAHPPLLR